jgi:hypothetical protein
VKTIFHVTDPAQLPALIERVHDFWLDADAIQFNSQDSVVTIRYLKEIKPSSLFGSRARFPAEECFLRIHDATSLSVQDTKKIRFYDINTVTYDSASRCVQITTGVPITIRVLVNALDITIEETRNVVHR